MNSLMLLAVSLLVQPARIESGRDRAARIPHEKSILAPNFERLSQHLPATKKGQPRFADTPVVATPKFEKAARMERRPGPWSPLVGQTYYLNWTSRTSRPFSEVVGVRSGPNHPTQ